MQWVATGLLAVMAVVFVATSLLLSRWPALGYVRAFAEAAMVGACADWFAVTALFRRPFGLPIPHTAIIPRNKDRIGDALGRFIVENFLSPRVLDAKLKQLELAAWGGAWLQNPRNARMVAGRISAWAPQLMRALPAGGLEDLAGSAALAAAKSVPAAPAASVLLTAIWNEGRLEPLVERAAELLANHLSDNQEVILEAVQGQSWRWMPSFVDRAIARKITAGLVQLLGDVQQPEHPWRVELGAAVERLAARLATDPDMLRQGEALKQQVLDDPRLREHAHRLWLEVEHQLKTSWAGDSEAVRDKIEPIVHDLGGWLSNDPIVQRTLNTGARALVREVLAPRREEIGRFVAQVVQGWDARSVVERLELQVGPDLQYIRINGTIVGGLVGLALYALSRLFGLP
jgi:uncharacterized membrane-anchored protein YjiN (DUF445 family)